MSIALMSAIWPLRMPTTAKFVLISLADQANDDGVCWPKIETLAKRTGLGPRSVQRSLRILVEMGALAIKEIPGSRSVYTITDPRHSVTPTKSVTPATESPHPRHRVTPTICNNPNRTGGGSGSEGFERFWGALPNTDRRVAKAKCREVWSGMKLDSLAEQIIDHVRTMSGTKAWQTGYEPAPLTYLRQRRWEDGKIAPRDPADLYGDGTRVI